MGKRISTFNGKKADDILEKFSKLRVSLSPYNKSILNIVQGSQWPSELDKDQAITREAWDDTNHTFLSPFFSIVWRFEGKTREEGIGHGQDTWVSLPDNFVCYSCEAIRAAHLEMETVKMRADEALDNFSTRRTGARTASTPSRPRRASRTASARTSSCNTFHQITTESFRPL